MSGIAFLAFCCLPLACKEPLHFGTAGKATWKGTIWGMLLFAVYGITDFTFKVQAVLAPLADPNAFMVIIFGTALILTGFQLFKGPRPGRPCLFWASSRGRRIFWPLISGFAPWLICRVQWLFPPWNSG